MFNVDAFERLNRVIHERGRLAIMSLLASNERLSFSELKDLLKMTDGNLSVHMRTLEEHGYVAVEKSFVNRKPRTEYFLTDEGRQAFQEYLLVLEEIVRQSQAAEAPPKTETENRDAPRRNSPLLRPRIAGAES